MTDASAAFKRTELSIDDGTTNKKSQVDAKIDEVLENFTLILSSRKSLKILLTPDTKTTNFSIILPSNDFTTSSNMFFFSSRV